MFTVKNILVFSSITFSDLYYNGVYLCTLVASDSSYWHWSICKSSGSVLRNALYSQPEAASFLNYLLD